VKNQFQPTIQQALTLSSEAYGDVKIVHEDQQFGGCYAVSDLAVSTFAAIGEALAFFMSLKTPTIKIDQRLASLWYAHSLFLASKKQISGWDNIAGDYPCADGWIRLHTNAPHHKKAALSVLQTKADRDAVAREVRQWSGVELEAAIIRANGCAAKMYSAEEWREHLHGKSLSNEPLIHWQTRPTNGQFDQAPIDPQKPLKGIKVLDITRVIAGPVATRTLAALGAEVLRIDPTDWDEPGLYEELTIGKSCTQLDLQDPKDQSTFKKLLSEADVVVHGLRADALGRLGLGDDQRKIINPDLIEIQHNAYGWSGPWRNRRGFDSLVQMSAGIAQQGMVASGADKPTPLPVQALDHATGYLLAAAAITALGKRRHNNQICAARLSLARTAELLKPSARAFQPDALVPAKETDFSARIEATHLGSARRLKSPFELAEIDISWGMSAPALRSSAPRWAD
jgi:crotonobetainyl-CoA:carnitine CoA-transferase CaiB-like acyl-CoA transferase